ncbi:MAG TPA: terminase family protein [Xanthobacteraceae bacterium]|nr:terminase family protein [Xanthobacteraceae bacterium]
MSAVHIKPEVDTVPVDSIGKHLKKLHTTTEYLQRYCRWNYYKPHPDTQLVFHNSHADERSIILGSQQGKTTAAGFEMAFSAVDLWPAWHTGRHPKPPNIERAAKFIGWYASVSSQNVRDGAQEKLLGNIAQKDGLGTGAIPVDYIEGITMSRGISNFVDTVTVRRETGGIALLQSKTYEQSVLSYQGTPVDLSWVDEDPGYDDRIYNELLARTISTNGRIIVSLTPMLGLTPIRKRFVDNVGNPKIFQVRGGIEQALHISAERRADIIASIPERERAARVYGQEQMGEGAVFTTPIASITFDRATETFPPHWPIINACDFSHGGMSSQSHPFAYVSAARDPATGTIYIFDAKKFFQMLPEQHVAKIKESKVWDAPWLWPHDGSQVAQAGTGETISRMYRRLGLPLRNEHTTFSDKDGGGYSFEAGIALLEQKFANGTLLIARHLHDVFIEYQNYHYKDGNVVKEDDDLLSAIRQVVMGIRYAKALDSGGGVFDRMYARNDRPQIADGVTFPLFGR